MKFIGMEIKVKGSFLDLVGFFKTEDSDLNTMRFDAFSQ